ncbi:MAG: SpoIID/LytB domain-containing protein [Flavobacteriales bacterium]|nr:SpoIID/LytB domain-containing protein [Flavobacteriales bacterium]
MTYFKSGSSNSFIGCLILMISISSAFVGRVSAQVRVGILVKQNLRTVLISPAQGKYILTNELSDTIYTFRTDDAVSVSQVGDRLVVKSAYGLNDTLTSCFLIGSGNGAAFKMRVGNEPQDLLYYDSLQILPETKGLRLVNAVSVERYVSRVVQAEVGYGAAEEYYKIQSIICRTYAIRNLERHALDGYDVCDHEHCQVYSGSKNPTDEVVKATAATSGLVMLSAENDLILSAFHSNCGGQTANSEDVWKEERSYLKSVNDTFCLSSRSATWEKSIELAEFSAQLGWSNGVLANDFGWKQPDRKKYFTAGSDSVETANIRRLFGLRSTYFDIEITNGNVNLTGRGYGHGVGLCQQGAMKMAEAGYTYSQILGYYYKGVSLAQISSLQP